MAVTNGRVRGRAAAGSSSSGSTNGAHPRHELDLSILGRTGLKEYAGRIYEEWLPELVGARWIRVVKEMYEQDPVVGSVLFAIEMLLRGVKWSFRPADGSNEAARIADFMESCLGDMSVTWPDTMSEILSMLPYGWAYLETIYKVRQGDQVDPTRRSRYNDGLVGWRKLSIRSQDTLLRWEPDAEGGTQGLWQIAPPTFIPTLIPIEKALLFRTKPRKENPEGHSVLRSAYRPWYFKKHMENIEGIGVERDLAGLPIAWVPPELLMPNLTPTQAAAVEQIRQTVINIRRDDQEGVLWPLAYDDGGRKIYDLTLLSSGGQRQFDTDKIIDRYDRRIAMTVMADFILLGHESVGSYALASSKTALFSTALGAWLDSIGAVISEHGITRLMRLNNFPMELKPTLEHGDVESVDITELSNAIKTLSGSGMELFPNEAIERYVKEQLHLPVPSEEYQDDRGTSVAPGWGPLTPDTFSAQARQAQPPAPPNPPPQAAPPPAGAPGGQGARGAIAPPPGAARQAGPQGA